ncbi:uncharacterized protein Tco025E_08540 [Trypanosoma conorhini]|uniref:Uncharacterized protein n=1 Tax=Trypanosoma conorhini TaxID=83891 RepID=A0A422N8R8_9TRYP|nr:uncharacterized protein Tco025E_08540 [Trypanosoma conorhini]RNF01864.1 hypothetical protein Tco025E_08540 [Trypanosoma conorhini]
MQRVRDEGSRYCPKAELDEVGYAPFSFYLQNIIVAVMVGVRRMSQSDQSQVSNERVTLIEVDAEGFQASKGVEAGQARISHRTNENDDNQKFIASSFAASVSSSAKQAVPVDL